MGASSTPSFPGQFADRWRSSYSHGRVDQDLPLVLVIDDDPDARIVWTSCLSHLGYRTATEANGEGGVRSALRLRPLAILMDLCMPDLEGLEATRRIKAGAQTHDSLIIVVTGRGLDLLEEARAAGCDAYFCKPFNAFMLDAILRTLRGVGERYNKAPRIRRCPCGREYTQQTWSLLQFCGRIFCGSTSNLSRNQAVEVRLCPCGNPIAMPVSEGSPEPGVKTPRARRLMTGAQG